MTNKERFLKLVSEDDTQTLIEIKNRIKKRMENTAMQTLIDELKDYKRTTYSDKLVITFWICMAERLLEMEKQQIIDAFKSGDCNGTFETINAEQYYNEKYNV